LFDYEANKDKLLSSSGQRLTTQLFEELARGDVAAKPVFKLSDWRKKYVEIADPTGYEAAMELLGDWEHWLLLTKAPGFAAALKEWNEEVDVKLRSEGVKQLRKQAKLPTGTAAAKVLAGIEGKKAKPKAEEPGESEKEIKRRTSDDARRLGLHAVK
jgi:hypothetical protein